MTVTIKISNPTAGRIQVSIENDRNGREKIISNAAMSEAAEVMIEAIDLADILGCHIKHNIPGNVGEVMRAWMGEIRRTDGSRI